MTLYFDVEALVPVIREAGAAILSKYKLHNEITFKEDRSPLTEADQLSHTLLERGLKAIAPDLPVLSEEGEQYPYEIRKNWDRYFLIDPLDGTKGFIRRTDEFSVNIALIEDRRCVMGLIHVPVSGITYIASSGQGAFRVDGDHRERLPVVRNLHGPIRIVLSRDDQSKELSQARERIGPTDILSISSSLKFALLAEGSADFYPRRIGSMEWDIAPGSVLIEESGGMMCLFDAEPVVYNRPNLLNPPFVAMSRAFIERYPDWKDILTPFRAGERQQSDVEK